MLRVAVLFGGRSGEHEVSLMSARSVIGALDPDRYQVTGVGITHEGRWLTGPGAMQTLEAFEGSEWEGLAPATIPAEPGRRALHRGADRPQEIDVVFPVLHGTYGEDGTVQGLLELAEIPYVGAGVLASSVAMDKGLFKQLMRAHGVQVVDSVVLLKSEMQADPQAALDRAMQAGDFPLFTKPANLGSSVGVSKVRSRADLWEGLMEAATYDRRVLVERGLEAREIEVSVLGNDRPEAAPVVGEIVPSDEFYTYRAKYLDDRSELRIPAPIDRATTEEARRLAVEAYRAVDCAGMARVDFLLDKGSGELFVSEVNTIPGFTRISMYPKLWEASGLPYPRLMDRLIELALERHAQKSGLTRAYGGAA